MNVLAFDCSTNILSVCLKRNEDLFETTKIIGYKHAEFLVPSIDSLFSESGLKPGDLDLVICSKGPGSFTGLRICYSTAKGISYGNGCPLISVPTLDFLSYPFRFFDGIVVPVIDARKKCVYTSIYRNGGRISDFFDIQPSKLKIILKKHKRILFTGPGSKLIGDHFKPGKSIFFNCLNNMGYTQALVEIGLDRYDNMKYDKPEDGPVYKRKSEAELLFGKKNV